MRSKLRYVVFTVLVIILGLSSRKYPFLFPSVLGKYPGDALWAIMVFYLFSIVFEKSTIISRGAMAITFSIVIELGQLYHAPWIDGFRATKIGHLILGTTFSIHDIYAYAIGVFIVCAFEAVLKNRNARAHSS